MEYAIAVDIGGTSIKYGLVSIQGEIIYKSEMKSEAQKGASHLMDNVKIAINRVIQYDSKIKVVGMGIVTAGQIDHVNGRVLFATPNIPGYTGTNIKGILETDFNLPTFVENDVNAATIGEVWKGAGIGAKKILCITVGTGIGGCIMFNGSVEHGILGSAGEVGHIIIEYDGRPCNCGNRGCFEQYASASALIGSFTKRVEKGEKSLISKTLSSEKDINAQMIFNAAKNGDELANSALDEFIKYLGTGIISLVHVLNPELVIIGGGISDQGEYLSSKINDYVSKLIMPSFLSSLRITTASLGNNAGIVGGAKIVFDNLKYI